MFINKKCSHLARKRVVLVTAVTPSEEKKVVKKVAKPEKVETKKENKEDKK